LGLDFSARYQRDPELEINQAPDGYVIYKTDPDRVHFLNTTAAVILELCDGEHSLQEILDIIREAYDLEAAPRKAFEESVANLVAEGLIKPCAG
jgi:hypothetical protein